MCFTSLDFYKKEAVSHQQFFEIPIQSHAKT